MIRTLYCFVVFLLMNTDAENNSYVFTRNMAKACKEHICQDGYSYNTFYSVDDVSLKKLTKDTELAFEMHIGIQGLSNGHILLSPIPRPGYSDSVYEIVVGGGGNQFTELRRNLKRNARSAVKTPKILSSFEARGFYIKISYDGLIEFGKEGEVLPLLSYTDVSPLDIKYFSFAAWTGVEVKFLYDCPRPGANETSPDSKEIDRPLSISEQLKRSQLKNRLPWLPPKPTMDVGLGIKITNVKYNAFESKLTTGMSVVISWTDDSMAWYPDKYNGTTSLKFRQGEIWRPKFYVFNSDYMDTFDARNADLITMVHSGEATFHFQTTVYTYCADSLPGLNKWPHDAYLCAILIQPWEAHERISIEIIDPNDKKMEIFSDIDEVVENEWVASTTQVVIQPAVWNQIYVSDDNQTHQSDRHIINVELKRRATAFNIVFYTPLLVLQVFVLMSFWSEPLVMSRVWFLAGCTIVISSGLCYVDFLVPTHKLPSILVLYTEVLASVLLALLIQILLMMPGLDNISKRETMQNLMTSYIFRALFCLPAYKASTSDRNGGYSLQEDDNPQSTPIHRDIEEMESEIQRAIGDKKEIAEVVDRILFVLYSVIFAAMLVAHFEEDKYLSV